MLECVHEWGMVDGPPMEGGCRRCGIHWWVEDARYSGGLLRLTLGGHGPVGEPLAPALASEIELWLLSRWPARRGTGGPVGRSGRRRRHRGVL